MSEVVQDGFTKVSSYFAAITICVGVSVWMFNLYSKSVITFAASAIVIMTLILFGYLISSFMISANLEQNTFNWSIGVSGMGTLFGAVCSFFLFRRTAGSGGSSGNRDRERGSRRDGRG